MNFFARTRMEKTFKEWDPDLPGFGIRHNRDGSIRYIAKISINGREHNYTIGPVDLIRREDARQLVQRMKLVATTGTNPDFLLNDFLKAQGEDIKSGMTFGEYLPLYIERYAKQHKSSWLKDQQRVTLHLLPKWANKRLTEITRTDFVEIFEEVAKKRKPRRDPRTGKRQRVSGGVYAANRLKETLSTMWTQAQVLGYLKVGTPSPTFGVKKLPELPREEELEDEQIEAVMHLLRTHKERVFADALIFIILTGVRHSECIKLRWDWFDFSKAKVTLPRRSTKNRKGHILPLSPPVIKLLNRQPRSPGNPYVFASRWKPGSAISTLQKHWDEIREAAGIPEMHIHDFRHTVGNSVLERSNSLRMVGNVLNQTSQHVSARYAKHKLKTIKPILDAHGEFIEGYLHQAQED